MLLVRIDHRRAVRTTVKVDIHHRSDKFCSAALWFCHFVLKHRDESIVEFLLAGKPVDCGDMRFSSLSLAIVVTLTLGVESVQLQRTLHQESQQLDLESEGSLDEASSLSATCGSVKCAAAAGRVYSVRNCQPGTVSIARAGSFFKARRAQCVEKFLCDSRNPYLHDSDFSPSKTVTCTRSNNWVGAANCRSCRAENNPRIKSNFQLSEVEHMNARIRTVCYERKTAHSRLWLSTGLIDVGGFLASAYYTDNMPEEYRLKFTRGRAGAGITLDRETVCQCARLHEPKSIRQIKAVIERCVRLFLHCSAPV